MSSIQGEDDDYYYFFYENWSTLFDGESCEKVRLHFVGQWGVWMWKGVKSWIKSNQIRWDLKIKKGEDFVGKKNSPLGSVWVFYRSRLHISLPSGLDRLID